MQKCRLNRLLWVQVWLFNYYSLCIMLSMKRSCSHIVSKPSLFTTLFSCPSFYPLLITGWLYWGQLDTFILQVYHSNNSRPASRHLNRFLVAILSLSWHKSFLVLRKSTHQCETLRRRLGAGHISQLMILFGTSGKDTCQRERKGHRRIHMC